MKNVNSHLGQPKLLLPVRILSEGMDVMDCQEKCVKDNFSICDAGICDTSDISTHYSPELLTIT